MKNARSKFFTARVSSVRLSSSFSRVFVFFMGEGGGTKTYLWVLVAPTVSRAPSLDGGRDERNRREGREPGVQLGIERRCRRSERDFVVYNNARGRRGTRENRHHPKGQ